MNQLNAGLRNVFQDLVERRLWPIALVLVVALIAIPVLLSSPASDTAGTSTTPAPPVAPATGSGGALPAFEPVVSTEGSKSSEIEKNLSGFETKDPFKVQGLPSGNSDSANGATTSAGTTTVTGDSPTTLGGGTGTTAGTGTSGTGTSGSGSTQSGQVTFYDWKATVRFGTGDNLDKKVLERFRALPNSENPVVVFMDVTTDGNEAVFLVSTATGTTGEGDCEPDDTCTFLYMKVGQTQSFEAVNANDEVVTYKLRLTDISMKVVDKPANSDTTGSTSSSRRMSRAERRARRAARIARDRRDKGFAGRIQAIGF